MLALLLMLVVAPPPQQPTPPPDAAATDRGAYLYGAHCAVCHGRHGRGDGPMADRLRTAPPDLTGLAARNRGRFDFDAVVRIVDGRKPAKGHGGSEMPIWGDAFKQRDEGYSEARARERILGVVKFLESIQRK